MNHLSTFSAPHVITENNWANISWLYIVCHNLLVFFTSFFTIYYPISHSMLHNSRLPVLTSLINWVLNDYSWLWINRNENNYKSNLSHHSWSVIKFGLSLFSLWGSDMTERLHFHFSLSCIGKGNGNPLSVLAWRIPGTGEPGGLPSMGLHRVGHDWSDLAAAAASV